MPPRDDEVQALVEQLSAQLDRSVLVDDASLRLLAYSPTLGSEDEQSALMKRLATLTPQQVRVLMMLSDGLMNKQIAYELSISEATVKAHVSAILQKLGVESRTQAVIAASKIELGQWPQAVAVEH